MSNNDITIIINVNINKHKNDNNRSMLHYVMLYNVIVCYIAYTFARDLAVQLYYTILYYTILYYTHDMI